MLDQCGDILTVEEVCEVLMIGRNRVYQLLNSGALKGFKIGKRSWKIPKERVKEYINNLGE